MRDKHHTGCVDRGFVQNSWGIWISTYWAVLQEGTPLKWINETNPKHLLLNSTHSFLCRYFSRERIWLHFENYSSGGIMEDKLEGVRLKENQKSSITQESPEAPNTGPEVKTWDLTEDQFRRSFSKGIWYVTKSRKDIQSHLFNLLKKLCTSTNFIVSSIRVHPVCCGLGMVCHSKADMLKACP
jgi:hypothetical protein